MRKRMRILQTYNSSFFQTNLQGFLLLDPLKLDLNVLNLLKIELFNFGFLLFPIRSQVMPQLCNSDIFLFLNNFKDSELKLFFLLIPFLKKNNFNSESLNILEETMKKNLCPVQYFFFYNNFFISDLRKFLLNSSVLNHYKNFFYGYLNVTFDALFFSFFFLKLLFLFKSFNLFLLKNKQLFA